MASIGRAEVASRRGLFRWSSRRREALVGYLFLSPWLIGFVVFLAGPMIASLLLSFTQYKVIKAPEWIGLANYQRMFADDFFFHALRVTTVYTVIAVPLGILAALGVASLLNQKIIARGFFRTIFYMPSIISGVAVAIVFAWIFNFKFGILNFFLSRFGLVGPNWLGSSQWALWTFVIMSLWGIGGTVVIYLAALQGVPQELYEAAEIDGAGGWTKFRSITLPMISPAVLFTAVLGIIASFQTFSQAYVLTGGGPSNATLFYVLYLYKNAFTWFEMGYASALAWVLFLVILVCTLILLRSSSNLVHYEGSTDRGG